MDREELKDQCLRFVLALGQRAAVVGVALTLVGLGYLVMGILKSVHLVATITAIAILLAYVIAPFVQFLVARRVPRLAAISLVYALFGLSALLALGYLLPTLQRQVLAFSSNFAGYLTNLQQSIDAWLAYAKSNAPSFLQGPLSQIEPEAVQLERLAQDLQAHPPTWLTSSFTSFFVGIKAAAGAATAVILIPLFSFYILMDAKKYREGFIRLFPQRWKSDVAELLDEIDRVLGKYIRGQLLVCLTIGVSIALLLSILGVPYAILIGVFAGIVDIVPYVGVALGMIPAFLIALSYKGFLFALFVVVMMEVVHWTEGHIIVPAIIGQSVGLPPLVVMVALGAGAELGGVLGMFLSMPIAAILRVLLQFYVARLERGETGAGRVSTPREEIPAPETNTPAEDL